MNKTDLINYVAANVEGITKKLAGEVIDTIFEGAMPNALKTDGKFEIIGTLKIEVTKRASRKGRNPQTGEEIEIPAKMKPKLSAGKLLKDAAAVECCK